MTAEPWRVSLRVFGPPDKDTEEAVYQHDTGTNLEIVAPRVLIASLRALADDIEELDRRMNPGLVYSFEEPGDG